MKPVQPSARIHRNPLDLLEACIACLTRADCAKQSVQLRSHELTEPEFLYTDVLSRYHGFS